jgi:hypothetical protein
VVIGTANFEGVPNKHVRLLVGSAISRSFYWNSNNTQAAAVDLEEGALAASQEEEVFPAEDLAAGEEAVGDQQQVFAFISAFVIILCSQKGNNGKEIKRR